MRECGYSSRDIDNMDTEEYDFKIMLALETKMAKKIKSTASAAMGI